MNHIWPVMTSVCPYFRERAESEYNYAFCWAALEWPAPISYDWRELCWGSKSCGARSYGSDPAGSVSVFRAVAAPDRGRYYERYTCQSGRIKHPFWTRSEGPLDSRLCISRVFPVQIPRFPEHMACNVKGQLSYLTSHSLGLPTRPALEAEMSEQILLTQLAHLKR